MCAEVQHAEIDRATRSRIRSIANALEAAREPEHESFKTKPLLPSFPSVHPALRFPALWRAARRNEKSEECKNSLPVHHRWIEPPRSPRSAKKRQEADRTKRTQFFPSSLASLASWRFDGLAPASVQNEANSLD
jgi:hypothetical protein